MEAEIATAKTKTIKTILDTRSIFEQMVGEDWNPDSDSATDLNIMFISEYGDRIASEFTNSYLSMNEGEFTDATFVLFCRAIKRRYAFKWEGLFEQYSEADSAFNTISITRRLNDTKRDTGTVGTVTDATNTRTNDLTDKLTRDTTDAETRNFTKGTSNSGTDTTTKVLTGGHTDTTDGTDTSSTTRSGSSAVTDSGTTRVADTHTGTKTTEIEREGSINDEAISSGTDSTWGFNSTVAVPSAQSNGTDTNARTTADSGTTTETPNLSDSSTTTHGKVSTTSYSGLKDELKGETKGTVGRVYNNETDTTTVVHGHSISNTDNGTGSIKHTGTDTTTKEGTVTDDKDMTVTETRNLTNTQELTETTTGYNIRRLADKKDMYDYLITSPLFADFYSIIFYDIASLITNEVFI